MTEQPKNFENKSLHSHLKESTYFKGFEVSAREIGININLERMNESEIRELPKGLDMLSKLLETAIKESDGEDVL